MEQLIRNYFLEAASIAEEMTTYNSEIGNIAVRMTKQLKDGKKILVCGNGGSASQSSHLVGELVGRFEKTRSGISCISLAGDNAFTTAWANDYDYESLFERALSCYGVKGDVLIALSTSGNSRNVSRALDRAREMGIVSVALLGKDGGDVVKQKKADYYIVVPHHSTAHIQEIHLMIIHIICKALEESLFTNEKI